MSWACECIDVFVLAKGLIPSVLCFLITITMMRFFISMSGYYTTWS